MTTTMARQQLFDASGNLVSEVVVPDQAPKLIVLWTGGRQRYFVLVGASYVEVAPFVAADTGDV